MKPLRVHICAGLLLAAANNAALAQAQPVPQAPAGSAIPVTIDNFRRAESDLVMGPVVKDGGFGKYVHHRELYPVDGTAMAYGGNPEKDAQPCLLLVPPHHLRR